MKPYSTPLQHFIQRQHKRQDPKITYLRSIRLSKYPPKQYNNNIQNQTQLLQQHVHRSVSYSTSTTTNYFVQQQIQPHDNIKFYLNSKITPSSIKTHPLFSTYNKNPRINNTNSNAEIYYNSMPQQYYYEELQQQQQNQHHQQQQANKIENMKPKKRSEYLPKKLNNVQDIQSFATTIKDLANMKSKHGPELALKTLRVMESMGIKPNEYVYSLVISAQAKSGDATAGETCEKLLNEMYNLYRTGKNKKVKPNVVIYNGVIYAHIQSSSSSSSEGDVAYRQALNLFQEMYTMNDDLMKPDVITYNLILKALSKCHYHHDGANNSTTTEAAEQLVRKMKEHEIQLDITTYNTLIYIYLKHGHFEKAIESLQQMHYLSDAGENRLVKPNRITYTYILNALSREGNGIKAEEILQDINHRYTMNPKKNTIQPDTKLYNIVIHAHAKSRSRNAGLKSETLLHEMNFVYNTSQNRLCKPDIITYNSVMDAYVKGIPATATTNNSRSAYDNIKNITNIIHKIESLLQEMNQQNKTTGDDSIQPNTITYNSIIDAYVKSSNIHHKNIIPNVERILQEMKDLYNSGENKNVKPNVITYSSIINAFANSNSGSTKNNKNNAVAPLKTMQMLQEMNQLYQTTYDDSVQPNTTTYNAVIHTIVKSGLLNVGEEAEKILREMMDLYETKQNLKVLPNTTTYNLVMDAYSKNTHENACTNVFALLQEMNSSLNSNNIHVNNTQPDIITYTSILKVLLTNANILGSDAGYKAEEILKQMHYLYNTNERFNDIQPNVMIYTYVMNIYTKSNHINAGSQCHRLLQEMKYFYSKNASFSHLRPDIKAYTSVMKAFLKCSKEQPNKVIEALLEAEDDYNRGNNSAKPDIYSFGLALDAVYNSAINPQQDNEIKHSDTTIYMLQNICDCMYRLNVYPTKTIYMKLKSIIGTRSNDVAFRQNVIDIFQKPKGRE